MIQWLKKLLSQDASGLDEYVEEQKQEPAPEPIVEPDVRAFITDDLPYRTVDRMLSQQPVNDSALLETELALQEWLFRKYKDGDINYVMVGEERAIPPGESYTLAIVAQRAMRATRLVLFSPQLASCKVLMFCIGVEQQGQFINQPIEATLYRLLTFEPIRISSMIKPGQTAAVLIRNDGDRPVKVTGALLGEVYNDWERAGDNLVRDATNAVRRLVDEVAPARSERGNRNTRSGHDEPGDV